MILSLPQERGLYKRKKELKSQYQYNLPLTINKPGSSPHLMMCRGEKMTTTSNKPDHDETLFERKLLPPPPIMPSSSPSSQINLHDSELSTHVKSMNNIHAPTKRITLSKQLSMKETCREAKWEHRRRQMISSRRRSTNLIPHIEHHHHHHNENDNMDARVSSLTDEDLDELRGSIELGFGFNEEDGGHHLCDTLPALNLYFAVNRQLSDPLIRYTPSDDCVSGPDGPQDDQLLDWKIVNPGDNPQHVKTRLRHWAQAVACSVRQCC